jgi:hypothetical protein
MTDAIGTTDPGLKRSAAMTVEEECLTRIRAATETGNGIEAIVGVVDALSDCGFGERRDLLDKEWLINLLYVEHERAAAQHMKIMTADPENPFEGDAETRWLEGTMHGLDFAIGALKSAVGRL